MSGRWRGAMSGRTMPRRTRGTTPGPTLGLAVLDSPFGPLHVAASERGVVALRMRTTSDASEWALAVRFGGRIVRRADAPAPVRAILDAARRELEQYLAGRRRSFSVPLDLRVGSAWDRRVLEGVRSIGFGEATSYGRLARLIGRPGAVGRNPIGIFVPCHRVVAGDGSLGGYGRTWLGGPADGLDLKRALLAHEGIDLPVRRLVG
jgi:methylated-DNA-[protein]-cysteine S-methyltransferase